MTAFIVKSRPPVSEHDLVRKPVPTFRTSCLGSKPLSPFQRLYVAVARPMSALICAVFPCGSPPARRFLQARSQPLRMRAALWAALRRNAQYLR